MFLYKSNKNNEQEKIVMEKLIVIEGKNTYRYNDIESLVKTFIHPNYYEMTKEQREEELEKKAVANTILDNISIIKWKDRNVIKDMSNAMILYDEYTYILSMLQLQKFYLLEAKEANIFGKYIDKNAIKDNYIIVNTFANEILKTYLKDR